MLSPDPCGPCWHMLASAVPGVPYCCLMWNFWVSIWEIVNNRTIDYLHVDRYFFHWYRLAFYRIVHVEWISFPKLKPKLNPKRICIYYYFHLISVSQAQSMNWIRELGAGSGRVSGGLQDWIRPMQGTTHAPSPWQTAPPVPPQPCIVSSQSRCLIILFY